jgi:hypothetical protein
MFLKINEAHMMRTKNILAVLDLAMLSLISAT